MIYAFLILCLLFLSFLYDIRGYKTNKELMYLFVQIILILVAGLRYRIGSDTINYIDLFYHVYPTLQDFSFEDYPIGKDPLYVLINSTVKSFGGRFYIVQFIQSIFIIGLTFRYFKKHSRYYFTCAFFYFITFQYFYFTMEIMRAGMSIVVCLYINDYIMEKKWFKALMLFFIAILFHVQSIAMPLMIALLYLVKFNKKGIAFLLFGFIVGQYIQTNLLDYLEMIELDDDLQGKANYYTHNDSFKAEGNFYFFLVRVIPTIFYAILCLYLLKKKKWGAALSKFQPHVMLGVFFAIIQMNVLIAVRYVDYFQIYFILIFSEVFVEISHNFKLSRGLAYTTTMLLFLPLFFFSFYKLYVMNPWRYIPYNSVLNKELDKEREAGLMRHGFPPARLHEY